MKKIFALTMLAASLSASTPTTMQANIGRDLFMLLTGAAATATAAWLWIIKDNPSARQQAERTAEDSATSVERTAEDLRRKAQRVWDDATGNNK